MTAQGAVTKTALVSAGRSASKGKTITDITLVAYPIDYRSSGVVTFIVTQDGQVYEKDLGPDTKTLAAKIDGRAAAAGWNAVNAPESC